MRTDTVDKNRKGKPDFLPCLERELYPDTVLKKQLLRPTDLAVTFATLEHYAGMKPNDFKTLQFVQKGIKITRR